MINPQQCVERIVLNDRTVESLCDLMIWMADQPDLKDNREYLKAFDCAYVNLRHYEEGRDAYARERANQSDDLPSVDALSVSSN